MAKHLPEFPTEWHQERYVEDLDRELAGAQRRVSDLQALALPDDDPAMVDALAGVEAVKAEQRRLKPKPKAKASAAKS
jgi:hypothetical protein